MDVQERPEIQKKFRATHHLGNQFTSFLHASIRDKARYRGGPSKWILESNSPALRRSVHPLIGGTED